MDQNFETATSEKESRPKKQVTFNHTVAVILNELENEEITEKYFEMNKNSEPKDEKSRHEEKIGNTVTGKQNF